MSTNSKDKISFILYEKNKIPRYHQFKPRLYKFIVYGPSILTFISIIVLLGSYFYTKNVEKLIRSHEPEIIKTLRTENILLKEKTTELTSLNKELTTKLASDIPQTPLGALHILSPVAGQKDLTNPAVINIQDIKVENGKEKFFFRFNIVNVTPGNKKLSGYIHLFVTDGDAFYHYPANSDEVENFSISYTLGESFATSRFRPVEASFPKFNKSTVIFKIIIFNRLGDLIHQQQIKQELN